MDGYPSQKAEKGSSMAIFKTETLKEKGLTQEQIDYIMAEAGKQVNSLTAERDGYKNQLATAQASLESDGGHRCSGTQTKINELSEQMKAKDAEDRENQI